ncbi:hypothetical protein PS014_24765, partial [Shigella sonnei]|nr:hypothetical protein [Shigella sonnei]
MDVIWKAMLTLQFHDILPGSCISRVYHEIHEPGRMSWNCKVSIAFHISSILRSEFDEIWKAMLTLQFHEPGRMS